MRTPAIAIGPPAAAAPCGRGDSPAAHVLHVLLALRLLPPDLQEEQTEGQVVMCGPPNTAGQRRRTGPNTHGLRTFQVATEPQTMMEVAELVVPCPPRLLLPIYPAPGAMREELSRAPAWICLPPPRAEREAEGKYARSCRRCIHGPVRSRPLHGPYQYGARRIYSRSQAVSPRVDTPGL